MANPITLETSAPRTAAPSASEEADSARDGRAGFRVLYLAIFAFLFLYVLSIELAETLLHNHFEEAAKQATRVSPTQGPIIPQIRAQMNERIDNSAWVRHGGVRVIVTVLGNDGVTPLYVGNGRMIPSQPAPDIDSAMYEAVRLLPAITDVFVSVPHGSVLATGILALYGAVLLSGLFFHNRQIAIREAARLNEALAARETAATRARSIERELGTVRSRLAEVEPGERAQSAEIQKLRRERAGLHAKLNELAERESALEAGAQRSSELEDERQALEDLLEEALEDVTQKEGEIAELQDRLKTAAKREPTSSSRSREAERLTRRMKTLYKTLSFDDRAIADLVGLRDEAMKLRAEEALKRLSDDSDTAAVRRKVGGLPPQLSIFELGFAGKGRIYYSRTEGGYRVLTVGAKNSQQKDLEYLSRLSG